MLDINASREDLAMEAYEQFISEEEEREADEFFSPYDNLSDDEYELYMQDRINDGYAHSLLIAASSEPMDDLPF